MQSHETEEGKPGGNRAAFFHNVLARDLSPKEKGTVLRLSALGTTGLSVMIFANFG